MSGPDFDELVGPEGTAEERTRLRRVHDLLVAAGPPPELPPALAEPPGRRPADTGDVPTLPRQVPRRRLAATLVLAAALVLASFGAGYLLGDRGAEEAFPTDFVVALRGDGTEGAARASLVVGERDEGGNWPMRMTVRGLPALPGDGRYELLLTRDGRRAATCGTFRVDGTTVVYLNAPYRLRRFTGWIVTREGSDEILLRTSEI